MSEILIGPNPDSAQQIVITDALGNPMPSINHEGEYIPIEQGPSSFLNRKGTASYAQYLMWKSNLRGLTYLNQMI